MAGLRGTGHDEHPTPFGKRPGDRVLVDLGAGQAPSRLVPDPASDGEVVARQAAWPPMVAGRRQERGVLAEEDGPVDQGIPHRRLDRSRGPLHARVVERAEPRLGPGRAERT
jgi:hypothetical protein